MPFILGPEKSAYNFLQEVPQKMEIRSGAIVVAWARRSGVGLLSSALGESLRNVDVIVGMASRGTSAEALALLRSLSRRVFVYHKHHLQTFHPKVYLFDDGQDPPTNAMLLVGSSNLTGGGLYQNIEGNLALDLKPSDTDYDRITWDSVVQEIERLRESPFCEELTEDERIRQLLDDRYISNEASLARKRRIDNRDAARRGNRRQGPEAPPPPLPAFTLPSLEVTFPVAEEEIDVVALPPVVVPPLIEAPAPIAYDPTERFYVRTLTENDINKLHGITPGTAEWDIGETARDEQPDFWGWPDRYATITRTLTRLEWQMTGSLRSSLTGGTGVDVEVVLWYREARLGHAAEHRLNIRPRAILVNATPGDFDTSSLVVLERLPVGRTHTFVVQLLTNTDPGYNDYLQYLTRNRPRHRFGYGP